MNQHKKALRTFIEKYQKLSENDWQIISERFKSQELEKNELLLTEGKVCKHLSFLERGLLRFFILKDGVEVTKFFTVAPYFFTSQVSFNGKIPARESIQTLEPSLVWQITFAENEELLKLDAWQSFARKITQEVQFFTEEILEAIQTETAEYRYRQLLEHQPELLQRIPLKHLASYLGVAPQSLSRIRKKIMR